TISYDCDTYGNPIEAYYAETFTPKVALYDGDTFIKYIDSNFVVWEDLRRIDYSYGLNLKTAGCNRKPDNNWDSLAKILNPLTYWTNVYSKDCYSGAYSLSSSESSLPFPIMNSSNVNGLSWRGSEDGHYFFTLLVIDPDFSYCTLKTQFSVSITGVPLLVSTQFLIVLSTTLAFILVLAATYFFHPSKRKIKPL
ncbi:hypothetical protein ROZALSC1DRAFT_24147, partial [Rozella allomycis CSF55]